MKVTLGLGTLLFVVAICVAVSMLLGAAIMRLKCKRGTCAERKRLASEWAGIRGDRRDNEGTHYELIGRERQLDQRQRELDTREEALAERDRDLAEREVRTSLAAPGVV